MFERRPVLYEILIRRRGMSSIYGISIIAKNNSEVDKRILEFIKHTPKLRKFNEFKTTKRRGLV